MPNAGTRLLVLDNRLFDDLYVDAMVLADEASAYLESDAGTGREPCDPFDRVQLSCESLKVTTRLMQVIAWLLTQRAAARGEIDRSELHAEKYRLGDAAPSDPRYTGMFSAEMQEIIAASEKLYLRTQRLQEQRVDGRAVGRAPISSPARALMQLLEHRL